jgi:hypothetical protein
VFNPLQLLRVVVFLFARVLFQSMRAFMYGQDIIIRDQVNVVNIERLLFSLKKNGATKQMWINDFFKNK